LFVGIVIGLAGCGAKPDSAIDQGGKELQSHSASDSTPPEAIPPNVEQPQTAPAQTASGESAPGESGATVPEVRTLPGNKSLFPEMSGAEPPPAPVPELQASAAQPGAANHGKAPVVHRAAKTEPKPAAPLKLSDEPAVSDRSEPFHRMSVFYATDRQPTETSDAPGLFALFGPVMAAGTITLVFAIGAWFFARRITLAVVLFGGVLVCVGWFQSQKIQRERNERLEKQGNRQYGSKRNETPQGYQLEVGVCEVTIPATHEKGRLEAPSVFKLEFSEDPQKHLMLQKIECEPEEVFYGQLKDCVGRSRNQDAMVFIHGYNVKFDDAVRRTAQIAHDVEFDGAPICYSWPSVGGLDRYTLDESNVEWTVVHLESFLNRVAQQSGAKTVHLVAHSMGNRALLQALERMAPRRQVAAPVFGQVVLAAPDVDASAFRERYAPAVVSLAKQVTLYASSDDLALVASTKVHGYTRAGLAGDKLIAIPGVQTVDVSGIDPSFLGHSYYGNSPLLIKDLRALVELGRTPPEREWLQKMQMPPSEAWWIFRKSDGAKGSEKADVNGKTR
jgi:esterase/lipase superfamily enzyme